MNLTYMNAKKKIGIISALSAALAAVPLVAVRASAALDSALEVGGAAGLKGVQQEETLPATLGKMINSVLGMVGVVVVILFIYGGFLWMTAGGSEEKVTKGKKFITNAVIGLVIVFAAYAITSFVVSRVISSTG